MTQLRKPFDVRYVPAQSAREASGGYSQCGYFITGYGPWREANCRVIGYVWSYDRFIPQYRCDLVRDPIYTYKCEYIPYVPASPATPARIETTPRFGWDAGARSVVSREGDCQLEFSIDPVVGTYVGLSADSADVTDTSRFRYAFYLHQANYQNQYAVIVDGKQCTAPAPYTAETVFKIRRLGEKVEFRVDDEVVHTDVASTDLLYAATTVYASGDAVPELETCCGSDTEEYDYDAVFFGITFEIVARGELELLFHSNDVAITRITNIADSSYRNVDLPLSYTPASVDGSKWESGWDKSLFGFITAGQFYDVTLSVSGEALVLRASAADAG